MKKRNTKTQEAFSLVELMILVAIIGILAAIVIPEYKNHSQKAKEAAAKDTLRTLRNAIEYYAAQHNDVPPGYPNGDTSQTPSALKLLMQLCYASNISGQTAAPGTQGYDLGPYLKEFPKNCFNGRWDVTIIENNEAFPAEAPNTGGWVYKPYEKKIKLDYPGIDSQGKNFYDY